MKGKNSLITLFRQGNSFLNKVAVELSVKKIKGVKAVAEDIHVGVAT